MRRFFIAPTILLLLCAMATIGHSLCNEGDICEGVSVNGTAGRNGTVEVSANISYSKDLTIHTIAGGLNPVILIGVSRSGQVNGSHVLSANQVLIEGYVVDIQKGSPSNIGLSEVSLTYNSTGKSSIGGHIVNLFQCQEVVSTGLNLDGSFVEFPFITGAPAIGTTDPHAYDHYVEFNALIYPANGVDSSFQVTLKNVGGLVASVVLHITNFIINSPSDFKVDGAITTQKVYFAAGEITKIVSIPTDPKAQTVFLQIDTPTGGVNLGSRVAAMACMNGSVVSKPNITLTKTADKTSVKSGDVMTYTIKYANTGSGNATNVNVTDPIPAGTTFVSASGVDANGTALPSTSITQTNGIISWAVGAVNAGQSGTVILKVQVK